MFGPTITEFLTTGWDVSKVFATIASIVSIVGGITTVWWRHQTHESRRLRLIKDFLENRQTQISNARPLILDRISNSESRKTFSSEPDVAKEISAIRDLIENYEISTAQDRLESLQERISEKIDFIAKYKSELDAHRATASLILAAIADRKGQAEIGLKHISEAKPVLGDDPELLLYEGLLNLRRQSWTAAKDIFYSLETMATGADARHLKARGAEGRADALSAMKATDEAVQAYKLAIQRMNQAHSHLKDQIVLGRLHRKMANALLSKQDPSELQLACDNAKVSIKILSTISRGTAARELRQAYETYNIAQKALESSQVQNA